MMTTLVTWISKLSNIQKIGLGMVSLAIVIVTANTVGESMGRALYHLIH